MYENWVRVRAFVDSPILVERSVEACQLLGTEVKATPVTEIGSRKTHKDVIPIRHECANGCCGSAKAGHQVGDMSLPIESLSMAS